MKKALLILSLAGLLMMANSGMANSQEKPKPKKDTVNMDSNAKPTLYYPVEDEKAKAPAAPKSNSSTGTIVMIVGAVIIVGATIFFMMKKKKK
jgi:LPXTG-motif cell wall-anchored protein